MAFHELGTNALKYGALSQPGGQVDLSWRSGGDPPMLELNWCERGGRRSSRQRRGALVRDCLSVDRPPSCAAK